MTLTWIVEGIMVRGPAAASIGGLGAKYAKKADLPYLIGLDMSNVLLGKPGRGPYRSLDFKS